MSIHLEYGNYKIIQVLKIHYLVLKLFLLNSNLSTNLIPFSVWSTATNPSALVTRKVPSPLSIKCLVATALSYLVINIDRVIILPI